jgi:ABC-2 type transport system permease protein
MAVAERPVIERSATRVNTIRQLWELLAVLTHTLLTTRYRRSVLGFFWSLIVPLFQIVIVGFVFQAILQQNIPNYTLVFLTALVPWIYFNDAALASCAVFLRFREVVRKIAFPRWILPIAVVTSSLVHFGLSMVVLFALFAFIPVYYNPNFLMLIPLTAILTVLLIGMALALSVLHTYYQDVEYALTMLIRMLFFVTPVMYPAAQIPEHYRYWMMFNPVAAICEGFRAMLPGYELPAIEHLVTAAISSILMILIGVLVFRRMNPQLPEVL